MSEQESCEWRLKEYPMTFESGCGAEWIDPESSLEDIKNNFNFCPICGKPLTIKRD